MKKLNRHSSETNLLSVAGLNLVFSVPFLVFKTLSTIFGSSSSAPGFTVVLQKNRKPRGRALLKGSRREYSQFTVLNLKEGRPKSSYLPQQANFESLRDEWFASLGPSSDLEEIAMIWPYQRIIGMGYPAVPLILNELQERPHHWFWALRAITGENPVPSSARGNIEEMAKYWLQWGAENGFITDEPARTTTL